MHKNGKSSTMKKNILITLVATITLITISLLSEILYIYNKRPEYVALLYLWKAQNLASTNFNKSLYYLSRAAKLNITQGSKIYPDLIPKNYEPDFTQNDYSQGFRTSYEGFIKDVSIKNIFNSDKIDQAFIFYNLGILEYENGDTDNARAFLQASVYISPDLGHYHVELANLYLVYKEPEKARQELNFCLKFNSPQKQCEEYKTFYLETDTPQPVGFLYRDLEEYYLNSSSLKAAPRLFRAE
jgi:hypothetical protein